MSYEKVLSQISSEYQRILSDNLVGIYIHGSIAFGCFNPNRSDIDFIVVVNKIPTICEKESLIQILLDLSGEAPTKGFEMSVVLASACKRVTYPTSFELHYSVTHLQSCKYDLTSYCKSMNGVDEDLASHFTVIKNVGYPLVGKPISETFGDVPTCHYWDSIKKDIENARDDVVDNPVYIILNLCRVLAYKNSKLILSKETGGLWGENNLHVKYSQLIHKAISAYNSDTEEVFDEELCKDFCDYMLSFIFAK